MNCKHIQELIITDYVDGRASQAVQKQVRAHLAACGECRAFEQAVRAKAVQPFAAAEHEQPPHQVWQNIKVAIQQAPVQPQPSWLERIWFVVRENAALRRPAYALVPVMTLVLLVTLYFQSPYHKQALVQDYLGQKAVFMAAMGGSANGDLDNVASFNTAIEEYLY
jgi:anti-sigma factor RsiW